MKYRIAYPTIVCLAALGLAAGCSKELPAGNEQTAGEKYTRIVFASSGFTKAADLHPPTAGNEDGIRSLHVYGVAHQADGKIIHIFHAPGVNPTQESQIWGEIRGDTAVVMSSLFEKNARGEQVEYVNLYALANIEQLEPAYPNLFNSFTAYNIQISDAVKKHLSSQRTPIGQKVEDMLKDLVIQAKSLSTALAYPVMAQSMRVDGGVSFLRMPLERIYCRIGFSFLFTGNPADKITIETVTIDKTSTQGYLFLEENEVPGAVPSGSLVWSASRNGQGSFKDAAGNVYLNGEQPTRGALVTLHADTGGRSQLYFRTCQYLCDDRAEAPSITLDISVAGVGGTSTTRRLTAPLYSIGGTGGKLNYGFLRNHSYQVISTVNTSTLQLEEVVVEMHDWNVRPPVDIPNFE